jgi:GTPase
VQAIRQANRAAGGVNWTTRSGSIFSVADPDWIRAVSDSVRRSGCGKAKMVASHESLKELEAEVKAQVQAIRQANRAAGGVNWTTRSGSIFSVGDPDWIGAVLDSVRWSGCGKAKMVASHESLRELEAEVKAQVQAIRQANRAAGGVN